MHRYVHRLWHVRKSVPFFILFLPLFCLLYFAELLYRAGFWIVWQYRKRCKKARHFSPTIISVGNLTVGGTGKSVVVRYLIKKYGAQKCGVVMRGYRGKNERKNTPLFVGGWGTVCAQPEDAGDEAYALVQTTTVPVVVCRNRADAVEHLLVCAKKNSQKIDVIFVDDGYQNQSIKKDQEIVLLDTRAPFGNGHCLPAGPLREKDLSRADLIIATHADEGSNMSRRALVTEVARQKSDLFARHNIFWGIHHFSGIFDHSGKKVPQHALQNKRFVAVSGIGVPHGFLSMLTKNDILYKKSVTFRDHHAYSRADIDSIFESAGSGPIVTTQKDWVKIKPLLSEGERCRWYVACVEFVPVECTQLLG